MEPYRENLFKFHHPNIGYTETLEDLLCLGTLIACQVIKPTSTLDDMQMWYGNNKYVKEDCVNCSCRWHCLAVEINN